MQGALILFPLLFLAAFLDSAAGGGALISLPAYMLAGFPPHVCSATNKVSAGISALFSTARYIKNGKVVWRPVVFACVGALIGSTVGAKVALLLDESLLLTIMLVSLPIVGAVLIASQFRKPKEQEQPEQKMPDRWVPLVSLAVGLAVGFYDGFFGPGAGTFLIFAFNGLLGMELISAAGSARTVNFASNVASVITYAMGGKVLWMVGLPAAIFSTAGGQLGTYFAMKKGAKFIRPLMIVVVVCLISKVAFDFFTR